MNTPTYLKNRLRALVKDCAAILRQNAAELRALGEPRAADTAIAMSDVTDALLEISVADPPSEKACLLTAANVHALRDGNGLGDTIIWPAYRRVGMHRSAEEWTLLTNTVREISSKLQKSK